MEKKFFPPVMRSRFFWRDNSHAQLDDWQVTEILHHGTLRETACRVNTLGSQLLGFQKAARGEVPYAPDCLTMLKGAHSQEEQRLPSSVPLEPTEEAFPSTSQQGTNMLVSHVGKTVDVKARGNRFNN